jgi:death-on-curing protein
MIVWIEKPLALAMHDRQLAEHGGSAGVRDEQLLESALARPQQLHAYGEPPPDLAAWLRQHVTLKPGKRVNEKRARYR